MNNAPQKIPNEDRIHHPFSPSSLPSRAACPKYENRNSTNEAAIMGSIQHNMVETQTDDHRVSDKHAAAVAQCIIFAEERLALYPGGRTLREVYLPIDDDVIVIDVHTIERFDIVTDDGQISPGFRGKRTRQVFDGTTAGFLDEAIISADETEAEIIDWKFGKNAVTDAKDNLQGIAYMLGLKRIIPTLRKCRVIFMQPHIDELSEHLFDLSPESHDNLYLRVKTVVARSVEAHRRPDDFSTARPNVGTCLFCNLVGRCPKVAELVIELGQKYRPLSVPLNVNPSTISDPKDVDAGIRLSDVVKTWAEAFRRQATEKTIENFDFVPEGYTLVTTTKRSIVDSRAVGNIAKTFIPTERHGEVEKLYSIALGPLEEMISEGAARGQKEKTVEEFGARLLDAKAVELGNPFAFLRQAKKSETKTKPAN